MIIRKYEPKDEKGWVRCRVLSFLDSAYFDNVLKEKEKYENNSIELVAVEEGNIVGLIDIELESDIGQVCSNDQFLSGMIWHIAVHPDYRKQGIASKLLDKAEELSKQHGIERIEAWTRDDEFVRNWYIKHNFIERDSYLHVYMEGGNEIKDAITPEIPKLYPIQAFAHYVGEEKEKIKEQFKRVHECMMFDKQL
ncbi:GNAT family N-acetyltransferase [Bacillus horti]|uniref:Ribosomal protein S18 acetylase RimI-like enzyme n=1 Tax=Caldalkalibacillus horti TaxID=77523 RepID=A0ABT9VXN6_9BACI|nr:GNAT family N-acetyltransferase [Bacillus horti]MDQ0165757.1 ribosomal protein S18 acetylase RimI-like enzyme [Bacillus horti]